MSHLVKDLKSMVPPDEWMTVNTQIVKLVNKWANRDDLLVCVGPEAGGATALYDPRQGQIEINTDVAFGEGTDPAYIGDLNQRKVQFEYPKSSGAILHEAAHARFTTWSLEDSHRDLPQDVNEWLHLLEESRIEKQILRVMPENKPFIRSCILEIVLGEEDTEEVKKLSGIRRAARLCLLALARVDSGSLQKKDMKTTRAALDDLLGTTLLVQLRNIWLEFQNITDPTRDLQRMYDLAQKWADLIDEAAEDEDKQEQEAQEQAEAMAQAIQDIMKQLGKQAGETEIEAQGEAYEQQNKEIQEARQKEKEERQKEKETNKREAKKVFEKTDPTDKQPESNRYGGHLSYGETRFRIAARRQPTGEERRAAIQVGRDLEKAKYHDRIRIESNSVLPPGRLRSRSIVQASAYKANNVRVTPEPFRRVQRKHEVDPNLTVGVMFDISGSMSAAMEPMGATAWVMTEAVRRIQGKFAMVAYGHEAKPVVRPGQRVEAVNIYTAPDGSEAFQSGFQALDGTLDLLNGTGARLLVVVSDGQYKSDEIDYTKKWLKRCQQEGVAVLWLGYGSSSAAERYCRATNAEFIIPDYTPSGTAKQIGQAAIRALNAAGSTRV